MEKGIPLSGYWVVIDQNLNAKVFIDRQEAEAYKQEQRGSFLFRAILYVPVVNRDQYMESLPPNLAPVVDRVFRKLFPITRGWPAVKVKGKWRVPSLFVRELFTLMLNFSTAFVASLSELYGLFSGWEEEARRRIEAEAFVQKIESELLRGKTRRKGSGYE